MKQGSPSSRGPAPAVVVFLLLVSAPFFARDAYSIGLSAAGGPARPDTASVKAPAPAAVRDIPEDYDDDYIGNSWSAVLTVSNNGSVEVVETYDVTTARWQRGIRRAMGGLYNTLLIYDVSCTQGYAAHAFSEAAGHRFTFGYYDVKAPGRQFFTLKYHAAGMVVPAGKGARLQWRWSAGKNKTIQSVKVVLPQGAPPLNARAVEISGQSGYVCREKELQTAVAANTITIPVNRTITDTLDLAVDLPAGMIDIKAMREYLDQITDKKQVPSLLEYWTAATIRGDMTVDRRDIYRTAPDNAIRRMTMRYDGRFDTALLNEGTGPCTLKFVKNRLYLFGFDKRACGDGDYTDGSVCIPFGQAGEDRADLRYSMWGNYNPGNRLFFDLRLPPADAKRTDRVRFLITVPPFVQKKQVRVTLFLVRGFTGGAQLREASYTGTWKGDTLVGEYSPSLYDEQYLVARVFLPAAGFSEPGIVKKMGIYLSYSWFFYRSLFLAALVLIVLLLAGVPALIWLLKMKQTSVLAAAAVSVKTTVDEKTVSAVRVEDPAFSPGAFLDRARIIAGNIQAAWSNGDMAPVRNLVSQGVYNRFRLRLRLMREQEKVENLLGAFTVRSISLVSSSVSRDYRTLHVHVNASALDVVVPVAMTAEEKKRALERAKKSYFTEVYSFTRKRGAVTDASKSLLAAQCPSCGGAAGSPGGSNRCNSCGAVYNSGEFDWVLTGIAQGGEWKSGPSRDVPGLAAMETEGLRIDRGVIEDRAAFLFWQWVAGQAAGSAAPLAHDATDRFLNAFKPATGYFSETAVSSVDVQEVSVAGGCARATVRVLWSAALSQGRVPEHREHRLTLLLPSLTNPPRGFADHGCGSCGAPLPESDTRTCPSCGSALQSKNSDWLLDDISEKK